MLGLANAAKEKAQKAMQEALQRQEEAREVEAEKQNAEQKELEAEQTTSQALADQLQEEEDEAFRQKCTAFRVVGVPRDVTDMELWVLFSNCQGMKDVTIKKITGYGPHSKADAIVKWENHEECVAAAEARSGTTWKLGAYPVSFELVDPTELESPKKELFKIPPAPRSIDPELKRIFNRRVEQHDRNKFPKGRARMLLDHALLTSRQSDIKAAVEIAKKTKIPQHEIDLAEDKLSAIEWRALSRHFAGVRDRVLTTQFRLQRAVTFCESKAKPEEKAKVLTAALRDMKKIDMQESDEYKEAVDILRHVATIGKLRVKFRDTSPSPASPGNDDMAELRKRLERSLEGGGKLPSERDAKQADLDATMKPTN